MGLGARSGDGFINGTIEEVSNIVSKRCFFKPCALYTDRFYS